jgi:hypothetical protein
MERRKFTRFRVQDDAFAALRGNFSKVGKIYDISLNGMAFRYLDKNTAEEKYSQVDIFLTNNGFHLIGVPCTIIYDVEELKYFKNNEVVPHRCGVKFGSLKEEQQNNLEFFINNCSTGVLE